MDYLLTNATSPRLGITASGRYGNAPERSRFKRLVREVFRKNFSQFPPNLELNVAPRQRAKGATESQIRLELLSLVSKIEGTFYAKSQPEQSSSDR